MPAYAFEALAADGAPRKGVIQADTARAARALLRAQALVPLLVEPATGSTPSSHSTSAMGAWWPHKRVFPSAELAVWTRQLAGLVAAGLPLERALRALSDESPDLPQRNLVAGLRAEVSGGASFASALSGHPREFPPVFTAAVAAGEQSGKLDVVLDRLANDMESQQALQAKLVGAALYPAIVTLVALAIVVFLLAYVVPQVAGVFAGSKRALPWLTVWMLALANFVRTWGWAVVAIIFVAGCGLWMARKEPKSREKLDALWLRVPIIGPLAQGVNVARFSSTLALLSAAGVPVLKALQSSAETLSNQAMRRDALQMTALVREGAPLATAIQQHPSFPPLLATFASLGEQTGQLPAMLDRAARQTAERVQRRALQLATVAEPLLVVCMGVVVMLIVLAVLLPIMELNQLVK